MNKKVYMQRADALGTTIEFRLVCESKAQAEGLCRELWQKVADFDNRFSRFKSDSELSKFNERAGEYVSISPEFTHLLQKSQYFAVLTRGVFNPFVLPALQRAGYVHSMVHKGAGSPNYSHRKAVGYEQLEVGDGWARIPTNTAIDIGGIGKGYLADRLAEFLDAHITDYCLSLGGDMRIRGVEPRGQWVVDVQSATDRAHDSATYTSPALTYGIATSGTVREAGGKSQLHLIDPRVGEPATPSYTMCTVVAESATAADVLASCILIEGVSCAERLFEEGQLQAVFLQKAGGATYVRGNGFEPHVQQTKKAHEKELIHA